MLVRSVCVLALFKIVASTNLQTFASNLEIDVSDGPVKICCAQYDLVPDRSKETHTSQRVSDDYVDWLDLRSNFDSSDSSEDRPLNIRRQIIGPQIQLDAKIANDLVSDAANAPIGRADESDEEYVVPRKVNRQYKNNVIDVKKYIRPRVLYMQGPSRVIPAGSLRRAHFLPKRYRYDQDFSKLNTFWNNGYRWEIKI